MLNLVENYACYKQKGDFIKIRHRKYFFALNMYAFSYTNDHKCCAGLTYSYDTAAYNFVPLILKGDHRYFIIFVFFYRIYTTA